MSNEREPKKSETLEVRVSHEVKSALMRKAQADGRSASEVVRESIAAYLAERPREAPKMMIAAMWKPATAAGMGAAALMWAVLAPAPAAAGPDLGAAFERFDADRNGSVTPEEFRRGHADDRFVVLGRNEPKLAAPMMIPLARGHRPDAAHRPVPAHILGQEFARQDADRDGAVTFPEFEAFHRAMMQQAFGNLDRNRDGGIDRDELARIVKTLPAGAPKPDFTAIDKDGNGALSSDEFFDHGG